MQLRHVSRSELHRGRRHPCSSPRLPEQVRVSRWIFFEHEILIDTIIVSYNNIYNNYIINFIIVSLNFNIIYTKFWDIITKSYDLIIVYIVNCICNIIYLYFIYILFGFMQTPWSIRDGGCRKWVQVWRQLQLQYLQQLQLNWAWPKPYWSQNEPTNNGPVMSYFQNNNKIKVTVGGAYVLRLLSILQFLPLLWTLLIKSMPNFKKWRRNECN